MKLKQIRIVGFKSFVDETIIHPMDGITAIVGPNGCGKSNILDAVRWVLGEKSARGLRGSSMQDVIFLGSENRKQAGMAEVELLFDNTSQMLAIDQKEVSIGRRIYIDSASEYLLNGKRTTRREIERVFMDTGIGKASYSFMEQGRISEILRASPEERRNLFDEAAGISKFKNERIETTSRLADTGQNLLRLNDILTGKEKELKHLAGQAIKTQSYLELREQLDVHDKNLRYLKYQQLQTKKTKVDTKLRDLLTKRDEIFERIKQSEVKMLEMDEHCNQKIEELHKLDREFHQDLSRMEAFHKGLERQKKEALEKQSRLENLRKRNKQENKQLQDTQQKKQASMQLELDLDTQIQALTDGSAKLQETILTIETAIANSFLHEERNIRELETLEQEQTRLLEDLKAVTENIIHELEAHKKELEERESYRHELKDNIVRELEQNRRVLAELAELLQTGDDMPRAQELLQELQPDRTQQLFQQYESIEGQFRSILFDRSGLLAKKEELDRTMDDLRWRKELLQQDNQRLFQKRKLDTATLEKEKNRKVEMDLQIRDFQVRKENSREVREDIDEQLREIEGRVKFYLEEVRLAEQELAGLEQEKQQLTRDLGLIQERTTQQTGAINLKKEEIEKAKNALNLLRDETRQDRETIEQILPGISEQERQAQSVSMTLRNLEEDLYTQFRFSLGELEDACAKLEPERETEEKAFSKIKDQIKGLGQFNALAIEEHKHCEEAYEQLVKQKKDIEEARKNIQSLLVNIDEKSSTLFLDTFKRIQNNFSEVYQNLFGGGRALLTLTEPLNPLNCGVEIMVQPPGKKNSSITLLSGGEQALTAIALMFATFLVRPSPFCFLDEIDAPLDDNNVGRFLRMLSSFAARSQFLLITHRKQSMANADAVFGVTQEEAGISKIVSVLLKEDANTAS